MFGMDYGSGGQLDGLGYASKLNSNIENFMKLFIYSLSILALSAGIGQSWIHNPANAAELASMESISKSCPILAQNVEAGSTSKFHAVSQRDAYWRIRISDRVARLMGDRANGCSRSR